MVMQIKLIVVVADTKPHSDSITAAFSEVNYPPFEDSWDIELHNCI